MAIRYGSNSITHTANTATEMNRTMTTLERAHHATIVNKHLNDPRLLRLFKYQFSGLQDTWVVIPKGRIVAYVPTADGTYINGLLKDNVTGMYTPILTLANGGVDVVEDSQVLLDAGETGTDADYTRLANKPLGVAQQLGFEHDQELGSSRGIVGIITDAQIQVPKFTTQAQAIAAKWGAAYGTMDNGDFLTSDSLGFFTRWTGALTTSQTFTDATSTNGGTAEVPAVAADLDIPVQGLGNLTITAATAGTAGNSIVVTIAVDAGANTALALTEGANAVGITLGTTAVAGVADPAKNTLAAILAAAAALTTVDFTENCGGAPWLGPEHVGTWNLAGGAALVAAVAAAPVAATLQLNYPVLPGTTVTVLEESQATAVLAQHVSVVYTTGVVSVAAAGMVAVSKDLVATYSAIAPAAESQIVGQLLWVDTNIPPEGWLKWLTWDQETLDEMGARPVGMPFDEREDGFPFDPVYKRPWEKYATTSTYPQNIGSSPQKGDYVVTQITAEDVYTVVYTLNAIANGDKYYIRLAKGPIVDGSIHVYDAVACGAGDEIIETVDTNNTGFIINHIDLENRLVILEVADTTDITADKTIYASYQATGQVPGLPSDIDFANVLGSARILLKV